MIYKQILVVLILLMLFVFTAGIFAEGKFAIFCAKWFEVLTGMVIVDFILVILNWAGIL